MCRSTSPVLTRLPLSTLPLFSDGTVLRGGASHELWERGQRGQHREPRVRSRAALRGRCLRRRRGVLIAPVGQDGFLSVLRRLRQLVLIHRGLVHVLWVLLLLAVSACVPVHGSLEREERRVGTAIAACGPPLPWGSGA